jgi:hypothetical protein
MNFSFQQSRSKALLLAAGMAFLSQDSSAQQFDGKIELLELQTTLQVAHTRILDLEKQVAAAKEQTASLSQSAASANAESSQLKESYERLKGLLEGLGIGALETSADQVQDRLLTALSDLRVVDSQKKRVSEALVSLAEASLMFVKNATTTDDAARKAVDNALESSDRILRSSSVGQSDPVIGKDLHESRIVSLKPELGIAVLDVGARDGVKPGMPFEIYREDKPVAKVLVTEVRAGVSGAVVQELMNSADPVKLGDRGKVDTNRTF